MLVPADALMDMVGREADRCVDEWSNRGGAILQKMRAQAEQTDGGDDNNNNIGVDDDNDDDTSAIDAAALVLPLTPDRLRSVNANRGASFLTQTALCCRRACKQQFQVLSGLLVELGVVGDWR